MAAKRRPASADHCRASPPCKRAAQATSHLVNAPSAGVDLSSDAITKMCNIVAATLREAEQLPEDVRTMLCSNLPDSLGVPAEERHMYQMKVVGMAGETLQGVKVSLEAKVEEATRVVAAAGEKRSLWEASKLEKEASLVTRADVITARETDLSGSRNELRLAETWLDEAIAKQRGAEALLSTATVRKEKLESTLNCTFTPLRVGCSSMTTKEKMIRLTALDRLGKEFAFDIAVITWLPSALDKAPEARRTFDNLVLEQAELELRRRIASQAEAVAKGLTERQACSAKVFAQKELVVKAGEHHEAFKLFLEEAEVVYREADAELQIAVAAGQGVAAAADGAAVGLEAAKALLEKLRTGALAAFSELETRSLAVPAPPPPSPPSLQAAAGAEGEGGATAVGEKDVAPPVEMMPPAAKEGPTLALSNSMARSLPVGLTRCADEEAASLLMRRGASLLAALSHPEALP